MYEILQMGNNSKMGNPIAENKRRGKEKEKKTMDVKPSQRERADKTKSMQVVTYKCATQIAYSKSPG